MGNMEYFELCEISSKIQCFDFLCIGKVASYIAPAANACSRRKGIDSWTRPDATSCQFLATFFLVWKNPSHGVRHGPSMRQYTYFPAHEMPRKPTSTKTNILDRWIEDDKYRKYLFDIGWNEEWRIEYDEIALEDHSYTATRAARIVMLQEQQELGTRIHGNPHRTQKVYKTIESAQWL